MLDLQAQGLLKHAAEQGAPDFADLPPVECRAFFKNFVATVDAPVPAGVTIEDKTIAGPGGDLAIRIYQPGGGAGTKPVLIYYHGGGWVVGGLDEYQGVCSNLAAKSGCVVVAVDYRLAPEHKFPAAVDDCYAVLEWVAVNAGDIGADAARIAVAGDSAGGSLATVIALLARDNDGPEISYQALIYPAVGLDASQFDSYKENGEGYFLTLASMAYFGKHYQPDPRDMRGSPLNVGDVSGLPPATVIVAGYDPLRDEGKAYADKLMAAGVPTVLTEYTGMIHGFISMSGVLDGGKQALNQVAGVVREALKP